jgi:hypothetical protein
MSNKILFVGERRSPTAVRKGWRWTDGRLAAKQLFDAFNAIAFPVEQAVFVNLFEPGALRCVRTVEQCGVPVIAMGRKVQEELARQGVTFTPMVHPAARGRIRRKDLYIDHVRQVIQQVRPT